MHRLEELQFENTYARLPEAFYAKVEPTPLPNPVLVSFNPDAAALLDLDPDEAKRPEFAGVFGGQFLIPGSEPVAAHSFVLDLLRPAHAFSRTHRSGR